MNAKFFDLKKEKQDRMINASLKIFALSGYRHASTDDIVREAGISKGLLFHYFNSKLGVYSFIYDYSARYMALELSSAIDPAETSYMEIRRQIEAAKLQMLKNYPYMQQFLNVCRYEDVTEALLAIESRRNALDNTLGTILARADYAALGSKKDADMLIHIIDYTLDSLMQDYFRNDSFNAEILYNESISYINLIEKKFMKQS